MRSVSELLIEWYRRHRRDLPWRSTRDPYRIWISEIMLQQTRVAAVIPYYQRFLAKFPAVDALAEASEAELLAVWSGLGYYSRARHLQAAARQVMAAGRFPESRDELLLLPGIGEYTAAAIASIAFGEPCAVLDGNVLRVMARVAAERGDIGRAETRNRLRDAAENYLDRRQPGDFNQAVMELGAMLCLPGDPKCRLCPIQEHCRSFRAGRQRELPVKARRMAAERIARTAYIVRQDESLLLWHRPADSVKLAGFWELPEPEQAPGACRRKRLGSFHHAIVNHNYRFEVWEAELEAAPEGCQWVALRSLSRLPLSTTTRKALRLLKTPAET